MILFSLFAKNVGLIGNAAWVVEYEYAQLLLFWYYIYHIKKNVLYILSWTSLINELSRNMFRWSMPELSTKFLDLFVFSLNIHTEKLFICRSIYEYICLFSDLLILENCVTHLIKQIQLTSKKRLKIASNENTDSRINNCTPTHVSLNKIN